MQGESQGWIGPPFMLQHCCAAGARLREAARVEEKEEDFIISVLGRQEELAQLPSAERKRE